MLQAEGTAYAKAQGKESIADLKAVWCGLSIDYKGVCGKR